jgi:hypothetical protein
MVDPQKPIVKLGTKLEKGVVTGIFRGKIEVTGEDPVNGNKNVLRQVNGVKVKSFTGPGGKGITVHESNGLHKSFSLSKIVSSLS